MPVVATMRRMSSRIKLYAAINDLSSRMAEAARVGDWGAFGELEQQLGELRFSLTPGAAAPEDAWANDSTQTLVLIQRILEDDADIRQITEPGMERVRQWLGG